ncbi:MAG: hypothetical protein GX275_14745 [Clostridiales bacterium]|nr:hypothetical protein [Clostridiales bacterium]
MNYITPVNEFIVVKPSGEIIGFKELSDARNFISVYNLNNILEESPRMKGGNTYYDMYEEKNQESLGIINGVYEGECKIYSIDDFFEKIRDAGFFQQEVDELISKLLVENINLNVYDYGIDNILVDVKQLWTV